MSEAEIIAILNSRLSEPLEPVNSATSHDLLSFLAKRLHGEALSLTEQEIKNFREEVQAVFEHYVTEQGLFEMALEYWQVARNL